MMFEQACEQVRGTSLLVWEGEKSLTIREALAHSCLLYTSDAADDLLCVDLGGRRIINKKTTTTLNSLHHHLTHL